MKSVYIEDRLIRMYNAAIDAGMHEAEQGAGKALQAFETEIAKIVADTKKSCKACVIDDGNPALIRDAIDNCEVTISSIEANL